LIDRTFSKRERPLYLLAMAVEPDRQRHGVGRAMLEDVKRVAKAWPGDAVRLDAYNLPGGAGEFLRQVWLPGNGACHLSRRAADLLRASAVTRRCGCGDGNLSLSWTA